MGSAVEWENRNKSIRTAKDADQAEVHAVAFGSSPLEAGLADERIADAMDDYDVTDPVGVSRWAEVDIQYDSGTSDVGDEILKRAALLGEHYPFKLEGNKIVHKRSETLAYEFCLAISQAPNVTTGEYVKLPREFERLSRDVVRHFLGTGSEGYRTGWPPDSPPDRPARFKEMVSDLASKSGEWNWAPHPGLPNDPDPTFIKDEGIDFVVWKKFADGRRGKLFVFGQCACGQDWREKYKDLSLDKLMNWVNPLSDAPIIRAFATPHQISNTSLFKEANNEAGLTIDRTRITLISAENKDEILRNRTYELEGLIKLVISQFS